MTEPRSWLFVPADSESKIAKAIESKADAVIFDLEDSVAPQQKGAARQVLRDLGKRSGGPQWWVRVNPLTSEYHKDDLEVIAKADVHGIVLPKAESGADVIQLAHRTGNIPIHAIVTETPASLFGMLSYRDPKSPLAAMSWGAEDLSAALGASSKYDADGSLSFTYKLARSLCLAARSPPESKRSTASSRTSATRRACSPKRAPRLAKASPASWRSTPLRSARSMPPSPHRPTKSCMRVLSSKRLKRSPMPGSCQ